MANILEEGHYPENNKIECEECHCYFQYYNSEIIVNMTKPDEEDLLGGFGVYKYVYCPQCRAMCIISTQFTEYEPFKWLKNIFKRKNKKGEKNNG